MDYQFKIPHPLETDWWERARQGVEYDQARQMQARQMRLGPLEEIERAHQYTDRDSLAIL